MIAGLWRDAVYTARQQRRYPTRVNRIPLDVRKVPSGCLMNVRHSSTFLGPVSSLMQSRSLDSVQWPVPIPSGERIVTVA